MKTNENSKSQYANPIISTLWVAIFISFLFTGTVTAQATQQGRGFTPAGSYALSDLETINTVSGNMMFRIPLASLPSGRGGLTAGLNLVYNSKLYELAPQIGLDPLAEAATWDELITSPDGGWRFAMGYKLQVKLQPSSQRTSECPRGTYIVKAFITLPDGSEHEFRPLGYQPYDGSFYFNIFPDGWLMGGCPGGNQFATFGPMTYYSTGGTYMRLVVEHDSESTGGNWGNNPWTLYLPDGDRVTFNEPGSLGQRIYDQNNNFIEIRNIEINGNPVTRIIDQFDRFIDLETDPNFGNYVRYQGVGNQTLTWAIQSTTTQPGFYQRIYSTGRSDFTTLPSQDSISQITPPTQTGLSPYTFTYSNTGGTGCGEVRTMTLPTGAQATYGYHVTTQDNPHHIISSGVASKSLSYSLEYDGATGQQTTENWTYARAETSGGPWRTITEPDGGLIRQWVNNTDNNNWDYNLVYKTENADGSELEQVWDHNTPPDSFIGGGLLEINQYVKTEYRSVRDAQGNLSKTSIKDYNYDKNGNVTQVVDYDWVAYDTVPRGGNGNKPLGIPKEAIVKRVTVNTWNSPTPDASDTVTNSPNAYHKTTAHPQLRAIDTTEVRNELTGSLSSVVSRAEYLYDDPTTSANLTEQRSWDSTKTGGAGQPPFARPLQAGTYVSTTNQYQAWIGGSTGKLTRSTDANGNATRYFYDDIGSGVIDLYVTKTIVADNAPSIRRTSESKYDFHRGLATESKDTDNTVVTKLTYDVFGRPTLVKEAFGTSIERHTATEYSDTARRVITRADLAAIDDGKLVSIEHYDQLGRIRLSRRLEESLAQDPTNEQQGIKVQTRYFAGTPSNPIAYDVVSAPYRASASAGTGGEAEMAWRRLKYDNGGRVLELETFAGASLPVPWGNNTASTGKVATTYDGEFTTVTDQVNRARRTMVDGLGRLARVDEPDANTGNLGSTFAPIQPTNYVYNSLDRLTQTIQGGQTRGFVYSSLSRLISATNPENGTVAYTYDNNGNLLTKTDARSVKATYSYDALNRNTNISYNESAIVPIGDFTLTPSIARYYDNPAPGQFGKGRLHYQTASFIRAGAPAERRTTIDGYDELGRVKQQTQRYSWHVSGGTFATYDYPVSRTYDRAGNVTGQTYPSTRAVSYTYDNAGRISNFAGNIGDNTSRTYASNFTFNAQGQIKRERFGTNTALYHNIHYNSRGQAVDIRLGTSSTDEWTANRGKLITYFSDQARTANNPFLNAPDNNGNVIAQEHYVPFSNTTSPPFDIPMRDVYQYDELNRVKLVTGEQQSTAGVVQTIYAQGYVYDRWGNRSINAAATWGTGINNTVINPDPNTNRLIGLGYDAAGNVTNDTITGAGSRLYDAENRMVSASNGVNSSYYGYNADGKRVVRGIGGQETWYIYGISGEMIAEYPAETVATAPSKEYASGGQTMIAAEAANVRWTMMDSLGTPRMIADKTGSLSGMTRHDYLPFGEELFVGMGNGSLRTTGMGYSAGSTPDGLRKKFTGKERDDETGLDFFEARYYSSKQGRFTSPDEFTGGADELFDFADVASFNPTIYAELTEPQSLNKYQYCYNNPLSLTDPDGHKTWAEWARTGLEIATYVPGPIGTIASVVQVVDKLAQGDYAGAGQSALGAIPGQKYIKAGAKVLDKLADGARVLDKLNDARKQGSVIKNAGSACGLCFTAGTKVSTPDGLINIEDIRVGDRVTTTGLNKDRPDGWTAVDPKDWRVVRLLMPDPKGSEDVYEIELLRSLEWIRKVGAAPRRFIEIELAEMGLSGLAKVAAITACPPIKPGVGRVVLMTVTHMDQGVMEIDFAGLKKALEPTVNHPLFSADRNDWVPAGLLCVGEQIKTKTGAAKINAIRWKKGEHRVYNFEVEADHAYFVSEFELLSHNSGGCGGKIVATTQYKRPSGATTRAQRESVQGQACAVCGEKADKMVAGHKKALVKEHYETGTVDKQRIRSLDAVRSECPTCSAREGAKMSRYSQQAKKQLEEQQE